MATVGIAFGIGSAWVLARAIAFLQYGVAIVDPLTWMPVIGVLAAANGAASWRPAPPRR